MELDDFEWNIMLSVLCLLLTLGVCYHLKKARLYLDCVCVTETKWDKRQRLEKRSLCEHNVLSPISNASLCLIAQWLLWFAFLLFRAALPPERKI